MTEVRLGLRIPLAAKDRRFALHPFPAPRKRPKNQPDRTDVFWKDPQNPTETDLYFKFPTAAGSYFEEEAVTSTSSVICQLGTGGLVIFPRWRCLRGEVVIKSLTTSGKPM